MRVYHAAADTHVVGVLGGEGAQPQGRSRGVRVRVVQQSLYEVTDPRDLGQRERVGRYPGGVQGAAVQVGGAAGRQVRQAGARLADLTPGDGGRSIYVGVGELTDRGGARSC
jgi:hypothetical protein